SGSSGEVHLWKLAFLREHRRRTGILKCPRRGYSKNHNNHLKSPMHQSKTAYYEILGVSPSATQVQIKTAYYKQSFVYHPDKNAGSDEAVRKFTEIGEAYMVLGSMALRKKYDRGILSQTDLQSAGSPVATTEGPLQKRAQTKASMQFRSGKPIFDFDEFYRAHYGEQLERERILRWRKDQAFKKKQEGHLKRQLGRLTEVSVGLMIILAGLLLFSIKP
uniref:DnaJ heat shock protein family (Hsp40) member C30 n=2 Tax=Latimeria chalumnae TaxID=7897 RepID=H3BGW7_LATCH